MLMITRTFLLLLFSAIMFAGDEPILVPADLTINFFYADGQVLRAQIALAAAEQERNTAFSSITQFCGSNAKPELEEKDHRKFVCVEVKP